MLQNDLPGKPMTMSSVSHGDGKKKRGRRAKVAGTRVIADGKFRPSTASLARHYIIVTACEIYMFKLQLITSKEIQKISVIHIF